MVDFEDSSDRAEAIALASVTELAAPARSWYADEQGKIILSSNSYVKQAVPEDTVSPTNFNSSGCHVR